MCILMKDILTFYKIMSNYLVVTAAGVFPVVVTAALTVAVVVAVTVGCSLSLLLPVSVCVSSLVVVLPGVGCRDIIITINFFSSMLYSVKGRSSTKILPNVKIKGFRKLLYTNIISNLISILIL